MQNSVSIGDIVYFVGVYDYDFTFYPTGNIYRFNMSSERWLNTSYIPVQPIPSIKGCITTNQTHIFSIGGFNYTKPPQSLVTNTLQILDIKQNKWSIEYLPFPMVYQYCNMVNNVIYAFGGQQTFSGFEKYNGMYKYDTLKGNGDWEFVGNLSNDSPIEKGWLAYDYLNGLLYPIGGDPFAQNIDVFDIKSGKIIGQNMINNISDEVQSAPVLVIEDTVIIFGGSTQNNKRSNV